MHFADRKAHEIYLPSSFDCFAGIGTLQIPIESQVAGLHRAVPSVTLDKAIYLSAPIIWTFRKKSTAICLRRAVFVHTESQYKIHTLSVDFFSHFG